MQTLRKRTFDGISVFSFKVALCFWVLQTALPAGAGAGAPASALKKADVDASPFMVGPRDNPQRVLRLRIVWEGAAAGGQAELTVRRPGQKPFTLRRSISVRNGENEILLPIPEIRRRSEASLELSIGRAKRSLRFEVPPTRRFEVYIVQHTHTDIGYTADQPRVLREHLRFIDEALACIDATASYPPEARFKWVCEVNWGADLYMRSRPPEALARLKEAAQKGLIEFTALDLNMTDVANEEVIVRSLIPVLRFRKQGFEVVSAMQNDVNGFPWDLPRILKDIGVRYFANGINETRSKVPFDFPRAIWWESPDGSRLLTWRGPHYMTGNFLGLGGNLKEAEEKLGRYLGALATQNYPHTRLLIPISGQFTDNAPPTTNVCDVIKAWNEKWTYPRLRTTTLKEFFQEFESAEGDSLPRYRKAWCDWWADGIGAGADELAIVREAQRWLYAADGLFALGGLGLGEAGSELREDLRRAYLTALFFDEHTYGAANSISDPGSLRAKHGWLYKASFSASLAWQAARLEDAAASGLLWRIPTDRDPILVVFNPLPWERTCAVRVDLPRSVIERLRPLRFVAVEDGRELVWQKLGESTLWLTIAAVVPDVPPYGWRSFKILRGASGSRPAEKAFEISKRRISNGIVTVEVDPQSGAVSVLKIRENRLNALHPKPYGFGQYIYERIVKAPGRHYLWPRRPDVPFDRRTPREIRIRPGRRGPVLASLLVSGSIEKGHTVTCEITLWRGCDWVELSYRLRKPATTDPEAGYIAFPFRQDLMPLRGEVLGGLMEPGKDQIPRSASDWQCLQNYIVAGSESPLGVWVTQDAPLVQFGDINTGKYLDVIEVKQPVFYSWPFNNYWFTNFPAQQGGEFLFRYSVGEAADTVQARRFARERTTAARAFVIPPRRPGELPAGSGWFLRGGVELAGVKSAEDGRGLVLRFRNYEPRSVEAEVTFSPLLRVKRIEGINVLEQPKEVEFTFERGVLKVPLGPHGAADLRVLPAR